MSGEPEDWLPSEASVDEAYDVMSAELDHWSVIGPAADGHYIAARYNEPPMKFAKPSAIIMPDKPAPTQGVRVIHFKDKKYAVACVQWHSLQAVLKHFGIGKEQETVQ